MRRVGGNGCERVKEEEGREEGRGEGRGETGRQTVT